jgi:hypothetical protein
MLKITSLWLSNEIHVGCHQSPKRGRLKDIYTPKWVLVINDKAHVYLMVLLSMCAGAKGD